MNLARRIIRLRSMSILALAVASVAGTAASGKEPSSVKEPVSIQGHTNTVYSVAFSPTGKTLASGGADKTIRLWDVATKQRRALIRTPEKVASLAFSPNGRTLASGGFDASITLWNVAPNEAGMIEARKLTTFEKSHTTSVQNMAFSPDGETLATVASRDDVIRLWDVSTGKVLALCKGHNSAPGTAVFSPDGKTLASASDDSTVRLWDVASGKEKDNFKGHDGGVWSVAFSPDGKSLASGGERDKTVTVWDAPTANVKATLEGHTNQVWYVAFASDGKCVISVSRDGTVKVWDLAVNKEKAAFPWLGNGIYQVPNVPSFIAFSPDRNLLAIGLRDNVKLWDLTSSMDSGR